MKDLLLDLNCGDLECDGEYRIYQQKVSVTLPGTYPVSPLNFAGFPPLYNEKNPVKNTCFFPWQTIPKQNSSLFLRTFLCSNTCVPPPPLRLGPRPPSRPFPPIPAQPFQPAPAQPGQAPATEVFLKYRFFSGTYRIFSSREGTMEKFGTNEENSLTMLKHFVCCAAPHKTLCPGTCWAAAFCLYTMSGYSGLKEAAWMLLRSNATAWMLILQSRGPGFRSLPSGPAGVAADWCPPIRWLPRPPTPSQIQAASQAQPEPERLCPRLSRAATTRGWLEYSLARSCFRVSAWAAWQ